MAWRSYNAHLAPSLRCHFGQVGVINSGAPIFDTLKNTCSPILALLGSPFVTAFIGVKEAELGAFQTVVTPWEREHLLQNREPFP